MKKTFIIISLITILPLYVGAYAVLQEFDDQISIGSFETGSAIFTSPTQMELSIIDARVATILEQ